MSSSLLTKAVETTGDSLSCGLQPKKDAENAVELALGRSWGGRKFHANLTQFQKKKQGRVNGYADLEARGNNQFLKRR